MNADFDFVAAAYDRQFTDTVTGKAQRTIVWNYLDRYLQQPPLQILETNCGTGTDAIHFAEANHTVLATDVSEQMLAVARKKVESQNLLSRVELVQWDLNQPCPFPHQQFDLIFSNFGGLNCLSPSALKKLAPELNHLLRPGGKLIVVVMGRFCLMETVYFLLKGKWKSAFRRCSKQAVKAKLDNDTQIDTWYYRPREVAGYFGESFIFKTKRPVGFFIPPSYLENWFAKKKKRAGFLMRCEKQISNRRFFAAGADHYLAEFHKRSQDT